MKTLVCKFGGAAVSTPECFAKISAIIVARKALYEKVIVVVSAMGNTTDQLEQLAKQVNPSPPRREYDMLVTVGERISISLLAMALAKISCEAISFTGSQSGIITCSQHSNARIIDVRPKRLLVHLNQGKVVIVAGFQGVSLEGEITTLGRGGSDTTAVALGVAFGAERVEFFKDVDGIYNGDPKKMANAELLPTLTYAQALSLAEKEERAVLHPRGIRLAEKNQLPLFVCSFHKDAHLGARGTVVGSLDNVPRAPPVYEELK